MANRIVGFFKVSPNVYLVLEHVVNAALTLVLITYSDIREYVLCSGY